MNSEEFIQACEDGKFLVWGHEGKRIVRKNDDPKRITYLDFETGVAVIFRDLEPVGENSVIIVGPENTPIGIIPTDEWNILEKEVNE